MRISKMFLDLHVLSKHEILTLISQDVDYTEIAKAVAKNNLLYKDLFQDGLIALLETEDEKVQSIYRRKRLKYYFYGVLKRINVDRIRGEFERIDITELELPDEGEVIEELPDEVQQIIDRSAADLVEEDYGKALLKLSVDLGSEKAVSRETGITQQSINLIVTKTKTRLRKKYGN